VANVSLDGCTEDERGRFDWAAPDDEVFAFITDLLGRWVDMDAFTTARDKSQWDWTIMLMVPDWIESGLVATAKEQAGAKDAPARLADIRLAMLSEGRCVQTLHVGSFDSETQVLAHLHHQFIPDGGLRLVGKHHEIYLSDFRRVAPENQRTILRQPVMPIPASGG
jgi:hypothetical protein